MKPSLAFEFESPTQRGKNQNRTSTRLKELSRQKKFGIAFHKYHILGNHVYTALNNRAYLCMLIHLKYKNSKGAWLIILLELYMPFKTFFCEEDIFSIHKHALWKKIFPISHSSKPCWECNGIRHNIPWWKIRFHTWRGAGSPSLQNSSFISGVKGQRSCFACKRPHTANLTPPLHGYSDNVQAI